MTRVAALAVVMVLAASCADEPRAGAVRVIATPVVTPTPVPPTPAPTPTARATARPVAVRPRAAPVPPVPAPAGADLAAFRGLGAWVDVFDIPVDDPDVMAAKVRDMAARGVRTLYIETSRFNRPNHIENPRTIAAAVDESHRLGMRVVAWYPPDFVDVDRDVDRTIAAVRYVSPSGGRFDAVAADIEREDVGNPDERSARLVAYSQRVRAAAPGYPLAAIVIAPSSLEANPNRWPRFPWESLSPLYDVFMPMAYWTFRSVDPAFAGAHIEQNQVSCVRLSKRPCHTIGGEAAKADRAQVAAYVREALEHGSIGGGIYDYATTREEVWDELRRLNA